MSAHHLGNRRRHTFVRVTNDRTLATQGHDCDGHVGALRLSGRQVVGSGGGVFVVNLLMPREAARLVRRAVMREAARLVRRAAGDGHEIDAVAAALGIR